MRNMKLSKRILFAALFMLAVFMGTLALPVNGYALNTVSAASSPAIKLNRTKITVGQGEKKTLKAVVSGGKSKTVKWRSSNSSIVSVKNGVITAKRTGAATIKATANGMSAKCRVTVISKSAAAKSAYKNYLKKHRKGYYYAIVSAGQNKMPILIVTRYRKEYLEKNTPNTFTPKVGYEMALYNYVNGKVNCLSSNIHNSASGGPWYLYKNKLTLYGRRGGISILNIYANSFTRTFNANGLTSDFKRNAKVVRLTKNL